MCFFNTGLLSQLVWACLVSVRTPLQHGSDVDKLNHSMSHTGVNVRLFNNVIYLLANMISFGAAVNPILRNRIQAVDLWFCITFKNFSITNDCSHEY